MYTYAPRVLEALAGHGVRPNARVAPDRVRAFVNDLYCYELRALRARLLRGRIPRPDYAAQVAAVRQRYWVLSLPIQEWAASRTESRKRPRPNG